MMPTLFNSSKDPIDKIIPETGLMPASHKGLVSIYHDMVDIRNILASGQMSDSEKREQQFDADNRFKELIAALNALGHGGLTGPAGDGKDKESWLSKFAKRYLAWRTFKGFFRAFMKLFGKGKLWKFLLRAGLILSRFFWPLAIAGLAIWLIPKLIAKWPEIAKAIRKATTGLWNWLKDIFSFGDDEDVDALQPILGDDMSDEDADDITPRWDSESGQWMIGDIAIPGVPRNRTDVIKRIQRHIKNIDPELIPELVAYEMAYRPGNEPKTDIMGDSSTAVNKPLTSIVRDSSTAVNKPLTSILGDSFISNELGLAAADHAGFNIETIKTFADIEGFRAESYQDPTGVTTQGFGHTGGFVNTDQPMSEGTAGAVLIQDMVQAKKRAREQMGAAAFDTLPKNMQNLATQVAFSTKGGMTSFPKLASAMVAGDMAGVGREYKTHMTTSGGDRQELTRRNAIVFDKFIAPSMGQTAMQTTPTSTVVPVQEVEVVYMDDDIYESHQGGTSHVVSNVVNKNTMRNFVDPHYGHLGIA